MFTLRLHGYKCPIYMKFCLLDHKNKTNDKECPHKDIV